MLFSVVLCFPRGEFTHNLMQKPFADAAFKLKPGEVSDIVDTDSGLHLIYRYVQADNASTACPRQASGWRSWVSVCAFHHHPHS